MFTTFCDLIGRILNNVSDLIGAKTTKGKECCLNVSSHLWRGVLRDDTKNGCEGDYEVACHTKICLFRNSLRILREHFVDLVIDKQDVLSSKERWDGVLALVPDCIL